MGIGDQFVTIPAIPALKCPETRQPMVYAAAVGVASMFIGWRMVLAAAAFYVLNVRVPDV